ncbi:uncharacterized protein LOC132741111 [Ruditapes philippinarum]|uniref:uncharacterized protein LOC132741111 n=1 Tax=Ruditapes philippinarum TaxID=129788 RepID=UPI00295B55D6|nr:uncharacterized protein LOC132741111 [Ruditapes philippinarum]
MDFTRFAYFAILLTTYICTAQAYNSKNNGLGFFPSLMSPQLINRQTYNSYVYPNTVPVPNYIKPVHPFFPAPMTATSYYAPAPKIMYPALMPVSRFGAYPVHAGHTAYKPFNNHQDVVTKSVLTSVILSEILRRI